jgi:dUTP pyrophosphatase
MSKRIRGFEAVSKENRKVFTGEGDVVIMPMRGSKHSAGYDFHATRDLELLPGEKVFFWTDVKAYMLEDEMLKLYPRSSFGINKDLKLKNTVGIIDSDYYNNEKNEGNIGICLWNFGDRTRYIEKGEATAQGIFEKFLESDNCNTDEDRKGGFGSTDKNKN